MRMLSKYRDSSSLLVMLLLSMVGLSQTQGKFNFLAKADSILEKTPYGYIYISSDTNSRPYQWIIPKLSDNFTEFAVKEAIAFLQSEGKQLQRFDIGEFPRKWNEVYEFRGNYYLYSPSDWMSNSGFIISDSILYVTSSDADQYILKNFKANGTVQANITVENFRGEFQDIQIRIIDPSFGIYEWLFNDGTGILRKTLMQNSNYSKKLKMIVCDCGGSKCIVNFNFNSK